jgi:hypothetical protein
MIDTKQVEKKISTFKSELDSAKTDRDKLEGELSGLIKRLKDEFGFDNVEKAQKELEKLKKEKESLESDLVKGIQDIETKYNIGE